MSVANLVATGCLGLLNAMKNGTGVNTFDQLGLFVSNQEIGYDDILADLTECTLAGYARIPLALVDWSIIQLDQAAQAVQPIKTWTFPAYAGPAVAIYGAFAINSGGFLTAAWRFGPVVIPLTGGSVAVTFRYRIPQ